MKRCLITLICLCFSVLYSLTSELWPLDPSAFLQSLSLPIRGFLAIEPQGEALC